MPRRRRRVAEREEERLKETNQTGLTVKNNSTTSIRFNPPFGNSRRRFGKEGNVGEDAEGKKWKRGKKRRRNPYSALKGRNGYYRGLNGIRL